jgi:hypothetical protein
MSVRNYCTACFTERISNKAVINRQRVMKYLVILRSKAKLMLSSQDLATETRIFLRSHRLSQKVNLKQFIHIKRVLTNLLYRAKGFRELMRIKRDPLKGRGRMFDPRMAPTKPTTIITNSSALSLLSLD